MKLCKFLYRNKIYWGTIDKATGNIQTNMAKLTDIHDFEEIVDFFNGPNARALLVDQLNLLDVKRLAPVLPTKNVLCIGKNYHDHILEFDGTDKDIERVKENPIFFSKAISSIIGPDELIDLHSEATDEVDYEAELAAIIGKPCLNVSVDEALDYVYGYSCLNDVTARDVQKRHQQWTRGKGMDTFCPIGPYLVTADEIEDPQNLDVKSFINGELRQNGNTNLMIHSIATQISVLSQGMTLYPGDVIATGTPKGVGMGFKPPKFLKPGDEVEIYVAGIGSLINRCK